MGQLWISKGLSSVLGISPKVGKARRGGKQQGLRMSEGRQRRQNTTVNGQPE